MNKSEADTMYGIVGGVVFGLGLAMLVLNPSYYLWVLYLAGGFGIIVHGLRISKRRENRSHPNDR